MKVIRQTSQRLYFELRFFEQALFYLRPEENEIIFFGTDGEKLYYESQHLLERYLQAPENAACDYLHTVIHCLYQHPFQAYRWEKKYWDLASDIAVADVLGEIETEWISARIPAECLAITARIRNEVPVMSASHITAYLESELNEKGSLFGYQYESLVKLFQRDSHVCWSGRQEKAGEDRENEGTNDKENETKREKGKRDTQGSANECGNPDLERADIESAGLENAGIENTGIESAGMSRTAAQIREMSEKWKEMAESTALSACSFSKGQGKMPGSMLSTIQRLTREQYDYTEFLRKFAVMNERMKINMDEFDYSYYLYGLQILGKIPLIEPLEYKEEKQIREFVIVIDTSGSCSGELVQRFLNKTYNILCQTEIFSEKTILHIIQCDAQVQQDVRIDSLKHMEEYIGRMELRGGGGTDFRPAFDYVENLRRTGEFKRLCGLLYFTDGLGIFPGQPTDYKTAFVFVERNDNVRVPPWAMRIYLEEV